MRGLIACETLYPEIHALAPDTPVEYLPHDLHEFPVNVGDDRKIATQVAGAIERLEAKGVDSIGIAFAGLSGLDGLAAHSVPIAVSLADECVSTFRYDKHTAETGETKEPGVYYLTRGLIDRAVDSYKLALAYRGEVERLTERFDEAGADQPALRIDWQESVLFERAIAQAGGMSPESVDRFFGEILGFYHTVELVDTGTLSEIHHWYADQLAAYISSVGGGTGSAGESDSTVTVRTGEGDLSLLELLLSGDLDEGCDSPYVACFEPGEAISGD